MSEPNSLFAKITIKKENFDAFLNSKPEHPSLNENWLQWWDSKEMYGKTDLTQDEMYCYEDPTNESIINGWKDAKHSFTFSDYDSEKQLWCFGIIMFSENYGEMIPGLAFIKSVDKFKEKNTDDFAIVYNYFWGDHDIAAYIDYKEQQSIFNININNRAAVPTEKLKYTEDDLNKKWNEFQKNGLTGEYE